MSTYPEIDSQQCFSPLSVKCRVGAFSVVCEACVPCCRDCVAIFVLATGGGWSIEAWKRMKGKEVVLKGFVWGETGKG